MMQRVPRSLDVNDLPRVECVPKERDHKEHTIKALGKCTFFCRKKKRKLVMVINYNEELHWVECKACGRKGAPALTSDGAIQNWNNGKEQT